ncbi:hypothetical protein [Chamaesiphon minutus]|nr:hypothetical protein [Chamaesiphon minutus]
MKPFNIVLLSLAGAIGSTYLAQANPPQQQPVETTLKPWKIQPVAAPTIDPKSAHQALIARQKQLAYRNFSCDCNGCRMAAQQLGVTLN